MKVRSDANFRYGLHFTFIQLLHGSVLDEYWWLPLPIQTAFYVDISINC